MFALVQRAATLAQPVLEAPAIRRIRRNHGLEHATIHMLNQQRYTLSGRASSTGFVLFGDVPTERIEAAVQEALRRMRGGQSQLAVHPNCGTNLITTGMLTTLVAALAFSGSSRKSAWERFPAVLIAMMFVVLYSQPLGMAIQKYFTTSGVPGDLALYTVIRREVKLPWGGRTVVHQVVTRGG